MILKEIERLRALAVLIVLNSHVPGIGLAFMPTHYFGAGWPGVDLFFVISGFVISTSFLKTLPEVKSAEGWLARLKASRHALSDFYIKRAFRILPSALLWLAVPIAATALLGTVAHYGTLDDVLREAFDVITLRHNYTAALGAPGNIGVYWSLVIEEHFYILFPLLMILFWTRRSRLMVAVGGILMTWFVIRPFLPVPGGP
jgi:peptidoglycan/LPS O-acetylase OafA/YrhL